MSIEKYFIEGGIQGPFSTREDMEKMSLHAVNSGAHELYITGGEQPYLLHGKDMWPMAPRTISISEIKDAVRSTFGDRRLQGVLGGQPQDFAWEVSTGRNSSERFRVNISSGYRYGSSIGIVLRAIPSVIPTVTDLGIPEELVKFNLNVERGAVFMAGVTGSGKSTTIASLIKDRIMRGGRCEKVYTAESPVEFLHNYETTLPCTVLQAEIGPDIDTFSGSVRNILRRNTSLFLLGETRDAVTVEALLRAAVVGPLVYTTCHANSVSKAIPRLIGEFPNSERDAALSLIIAGSRLFCAQTLLRRKGGGMIACHEYLEVTEEVRMILDKANQETIERVVKSVLATHGVPMLTSAKKHYEAGLITEKEYEMVCREYQ